MGSNYTPEEWEHRRAANRIGEAVMALKSHPNYEDKQPYKGEDLLTFALRCIAHLVSPPMLEDEHNEIECTDLASAILGMHDEILHKWVQSLRIGGVNEMEIKI